MAIFSIPGASGCEASLASPWSSGRTSAARRVAGRLQLTAVRWLGATCWACEARLAIGDAGPWCPGCAVAVEHGGLHRLSDSDEGAAEGDERADLPLGALWLYAGAVAEALGRTKARGRPLPMSVIATVWSAQVQTALQACGAAAVCAVPPQRQRLAERGWSLPDQLALASEAPVVWPLQRVDGQGPRRVDRQAAPDFWSAEAPLGAPNLLLVDDVVTSGATLRACQRALEGQGWGVLGAVVLADARPAAIAEVLDNRGRCG